ncbi:MAG TPA: hypothetical protein VGO97_05520 [Solirubrobacterales bacterium]|jgi:alpha-tubulin suppressor-like RCC1 family protein|nr:hypothetical protein [Solirubrobacterales bacterium]
MTAYQAPRAFLISTIVAVIAIAGVLIPASRASAETVQPTLSAGAANTCAIFANQKVYCWGSNVRKQLGIGTNNLSYALSPIPVNGVNGVPKVVSTGYDAACTLLDFGSLRCWGSNSTGLLGAANAGRNVSSVQESARLAGATSAVNGLAVGQGHMCFVDVDQSVKCQGLGTSGQLGNKSTASSTTPLVVDLGQPALQVVTGSNHSCALLANKNVRCWGSNALGQLGATAATTNSTVPMTVPDLPNDITQIASGADHTCALRDDDSVTCWGANSFGQLGDGTIAPFKGTVAVKELNGVVKEITTGRMHSCALFRNGNVRCWGGNDFGQLGNGNTTRSLTPATVAGLIRPAAAISAGAHHTCARLDDGAIRCWGRNEKGQLGDGSRTNSSAPVALAGAAGPSYMKMHVVSSGGKSTFTGLFIIRPPVPGFIEKRCKGTTISTVAVTQDGVTHRKGVRAKLRVSGTKCAANLRINGISNSASPASVYVRSSFRGNSRLPAAQFSQSFEGL